MYDKLKQRAVDLGKSASSSDIIFDALRDEIISGNLKAGESIRQENIAKIFNVSRIPVREALKRLEAQGLVKNERYKGAIVSSLSDDEIEEIYEIRLMLEPLIIKHAVQNISEETLEIARECCDKFSTETDPGQWGELNRRFHEALYRDAQRPFHLKIIKEISDRIDSYVRAQLVLTDGMEKARKEHLGILQACEEGNGDLAAELTHQHIQDSYSSLMEYMGAKDQ
ncbi:GntR family transcriptional regulator [Terasakiella sp. A23]|uniref:GntR family transcriptional regulator n=1 Tax=Terasakiella sp. FCG-A23 TaxID=3080561 RepID=UPI002952FEBE|nr:GntR family transcriptional regulator [Terasakiella sp. A23]MDV7341234.1 GntR family transcriptional regulator [Terasakiella sp. A23]